ncbi:hypothetical protein [Streptomyces sp. NPDC048142]|uniref:hypothetical protein n=1 Tax=Streptomyces sp. NPDC048142 TaxID=3365501 RepID=UPI003719392D
MPARPGLLDDIPACTDLTTKPWVVAADVEVLDQPFYAKGTIATAGGCLASHYLAAWIIARLDGDDAAESALHHVAPAGEKEEYVERARRNITPYLPAPARTLVRPASRGQRAGQEAEALAAARSHAPYSGRHFLRTVRMRLSPPRGRGNVSSGGWSRRVSTYRGEIGSR